MDIDDGTTTEIIDSTKQVNFNECVKVILIPSRAEYMKRGLSKHLWWNQQDYFSFQQEARSEIQLYAIVHRITFLEARRKLYQPSTDGSDFFIVEPSEEEEEEDFMSLIIGSKEHTMPLKSKDGPSNNIKDERAVFYQSPSNSMHCGLDELNPVIDPAATSTLTFPISPHNALKSSSSISAVISESNNESAMKLNYNTSTVTTSGMDVEVAEDMSIDNSNANLTSIDVLPRKLEFPDTYSVTTTTSSSSSVSTSSTTAATVTMPRVSSASTLSCNISDVRNGTAGKSPIHRGRGDSAELDDDFSCVPLTQYARLHPPSDFDFESLSPSITLYSAFALAAVVVVSRFI